MIAAQIAKDFAKIRYSLAKAIPLLLLAIAIVIPIALILDRSVQGENTPAPDTGNTKYPVVISQSLQTSGLAQALAGNDALSVRFEQSAALIKQDIRDRKARFAITQDDAGHVVMLTRSAADAGIILNEASIPISLSGDETSITVKTISGLNDQSAGAKAAWAILVTFIILANMISSFLVWEERSKGYLEELIASPATHTSIMISKLFSVMLACAAVVLPIILLGVIVVLVASFAGSGESVSDSFRIFANLSASAYLDLAFFAGAIIFAISTICAILVVVQITLRDRMVISVFQMVLSVPLFFVPVVLPAYLFENASWAWAIPVVNIYADLSYAMVNSLSDYSFMPMMATNIIATGLVIAVGRFAVARIREWPAR
ncbi:ABC transporter permease subunit [Marinobacter sp. P4B1]|uniref:ABC transporter permease subunit n=1 Tax=Marinobacter sp. P4B1 TaxID=1119533 RepID=UPI00071E0DEA|nr:ABC transporter permease subunit [Marinobacter sp. P4B1]KRW83656.1 hypothetical protein AQ621_16540 [Marinobacter sp. P4B1]